MNKIERKNIFIAITDYLFLPITFIDAPSICLQHWPRLHNKVMSDVINDSVDCTRIIKIYKQLAFYLSIIIVYQLIAKEDSFLACIIIRSHEVNPRSCIRKR